MQEMKLIFFWAAKNSNKTLYFLETLEPTQAQGPTWTSPPWRAPEIPHPRLPGSSLGSGIPVVPPPGLR